MRFANKDLLRSSYVLTKSEFFRRILMKNLGLTSVDVDAFLDTKMHTLDLPRYRIVRNSLICQKYNIKVEPVEKLNNILRLRSNTLEHRINVLKDVGVSDINTHLLSRTIYYLRKKVSLFKEKVNIPANQNIATNIFGGEVPKELSQLSDTLTIHQYYQTCLIYCKNRMFDLQYLDDKVFHSYPQIKSISMIAETLKVLRLELSYDDKMIKKNPSVIIASADNIRSLMSNFTDILGIPIITVLRKYPFILLQDVDNIKQLLTLFKRYKIPDEHVRSFMRIFLVNNEAFQERIDMLKSNPNLNVWYKHPRMLQMIYHTQMTKSRLEYTEFMDSLKWASPQVFLLSSKPMLDKSVQTGLVSAHFRENLMHLLMNELGVDKIDLLVRHQHWKTVAYIDVVKMLKYLKMHFTIDEICPNIHIILYKQCRVEQVLADLKRQYSQSTEYSFTNSQYLALCMYMLEKDNHFTGDGIWSKEENTTQQSFGEQNIVEKSDNSTSTVEDICDNFNMEDDNGVDDNNINALSNKTQNINS